MRANFANPADLANLGAHRDLPVTLPEGNWQGFVTDAVTEWSSQNSASNLIRRNSPQAKFLNYVLE